MLAAVVAWFSYDIFEFREDTNKLRIEQVECGGCLCIAPIAFIFECTSLKITKVIKVTDRVKTFVVHFITQIFKTNKIWVFLLKSDLYDWGSLQGRLFHDWDGLNLGAYLSGWGVKSKLYKCLLSHVFLSNVGVRVYDWGSNAKVGKGYLFHSFFVKSLR